MAKRLKKIFEWMKLNGKMAEENFRMAEVVWLKY